MTERDDVLGELTPDAERWTASVDWEGEDVTVSLAGVDEELRIARDFVEAADQWDPRIRNFAAAEMTETYNDEWRDDEDPEISEEGFAARLSLRDLTVDGDQATFWFDDDGMFQGHTVCVEATLADGPTDASL